MTAHLNNKIALVTGASRGIGRAIVLELSRQGAHVIAVARTVGALEELDDAIRAMGGSCTLMPLDLLKLRDLEKIGPAIASRFDRIDLWVANAAMLGTLGPIAHCNFKDAQRVMDVNYTVNVQMIRSLDPLLQAADEARIGFMTSSITQEPKAYWGAYSASKAALEQLAQTYALENAHTKLKIGVIDPGVVKTKMLDQAFPGGYQDGPVREPEIIAPDLVTALLSPDLKSGARISL